MGRWKHDLYENSGNRGRAGQRPSGVNTPTKLLISNLYSGVTSEDIEVKKKETCFCFSCNKFH